MLLVKNGTVPRWGKSPSFIEAGEVGPSPGYSVCYKGERVCLLFGARQALDGHPCESFANCVATCMAGTVFLHLMHGSCSIESLGFLDRLRDCCGQFYVEKADEINEKEPKSVKKCQLDLLTLASSLSIDINAFYY